MNIQEIANEAVSVKNEIMTKKDQEYYQTQREAILNDSHRKELFKSLFDLYTNSMPLVFKGYNNQIRCYYSDEVEELADKIREQITLRDNQIFEALSK